MSNLTPDVSCKALIQLNNILLISESGNSDRETNFGYGPFTDNFVVLTRKLARHCERYMIHNANAVVNCPSWCLMPSDVQQRVKDSAVFVLEFHKPVAKPPKLTSSYARKSSGKKPSEEKCEFLSLLHKLNSNSRLSFNS